MPFVYPTCPQTYLISEKLAGWQLNAIPVQTITEQISEILFIPNYRLYFPRPWILVGIVTLDQVPAANPGYGSSYSRLITPAKHNTYAEMFQSVFLDLAFANTHEYQLGYVVNYREPGVQGKDFRGYFSKHLNADAIQTPEQTYNSIIQPESVVQKFCVLNAASTGIVWFDQWRDVVTFLENTIDKDLMGAPGVYDIYAGDSPFFAASTPWDSQSIYETYNES